MVPSRITDSAMAAVTSNLVMPFRSTDPQAKTANKSVLVCTDMDSADKISSNIDTLWATTTTNPIKPKAMDAISDANTVNTASNGFVVVDVRPSVPLNRTLALPSFSEPPGRSNNRVVVVCRPRFMDVVVKTSALDDIDDNGCSKNPSIGITIIRHISDKSTVVIVVVVVTVEIQSVAFRGVLVVVTAFLFLVNNGCSSTDRCSSFSWFCYCWGDVDGDGNDARMTSQSYDKHTIEARCENDQVYVYCEHRDDPSLSSIGIIVVVRWGFGGLLR